LHDRQTLPASATARSLPATALRPAASFTWFWKTPTRQASEPPCITRPSGSSSVSAVVRGGCQESST